MSYKQLLSLSLASALGSACAAGGEPPLASSISPEGGVIEAQGIRKGPLELEVFKAGSGEGRVTGTDDSGTVINCGSDCKQDYYAGGTTTLTATAELGSRFVGWGLGASSCGTAKNCTVSIPALTGLDVEAEFEAVEDKTLTMVAQYWGEEGYIYTTPSSKTCQIRASSGERAPTKTCTADFAYKTPIVIKARARNGGTAKFMSGPCSGKTAEDGALLTCSKKMGKNRRTKVTFSRVWNRPF